MLARAVGDLKARAEPGGKRSARLPFGFEPRIRSDAAGYPQAARRRYP